MYHIYMYHIYILYIYICIIDTNNIHICICYMYKPPNPNCDLIQNHEKPGWWISGADLNWGSIFHGTPSYWELLKTMPISMVKIEGFPIFWGETHVLYTLEG